MDGGVDSRVVGVAGMHGRPVWKEMNESKEKGKQIFSQMRRSRVHLDQAR